jgi:hypothetical protein
MKCVIYLLRAYHVCRIWGLLAYFYVVTNQLLFITDQPSVPSITNKLCILNYCEIRKLGN